jgi:hypothetical protein
MRNKVLIFSLMAMASITVLTVAAAVTVFAFTHQAPVQTEEVNVEQSLEVVPLQVEPVVSKSQVIEPVLEHKRVGYSKHEGGCPFGASKAQLTEVQTDPVVSDNLLTLVE